MDTVKNTYIIAMLGNVSFISTVLIAWPALACLGSKSFSEG